MEDDIITPLKMEINNFIWMHGPRNMTLERAEEIACRLLDELLPPTGGVQRVPDKCPQCNGKVATSPTQAMCVDCSWFKRY